VTRFGSEIDSRIPHYATRLIGREADVRALSEAVERGDRLITVLGPPGVGKTRLVAEWSRTRSASTYFVPLTEATDGSSFLSAVAAALQVPVTSEWTPVEIIGRTLDAQQDVVVVLDNVEQLIPMCCSLLERWLSMAPRIILIVTSRQMLRVQAERVMPLEPLATLDEHGGSGPAVALFEDRARSVRPSFDATQATLTRIVEALDGLPLAIELAAARVSALGASELLERLEDRLNLLTQPGRVPTRTTALAASIDDSWALLDVTERRALSQCSVFRGGFTLEAAENVLLLQSESRPVVDVIQALVDKSLVRTYEVEQGLRFGLYESIRAYAVEKLAVASETQSVERRHAAYFLARGLFHGRAFDEHGDLDSLGWLTAELDNVLSVLHRGLSSVAEAPEPVEEALVAWRALHAFLEFRGLSAPHLHWLETALDDTRSRVVPPDVLRDARLDHAECLHGLGRLADTEAALEAASGPGLDPVREARWLRAKAIVLSEQGRAHQGVPLCEQAIALQTTTGDKSGESLTRRALGAMLAESGRWSDAQREIERALVVDERAGNKIRQTGSLVTLANLHLRRGASNVAAGTYLQALSFARELRYIPPEKFILGALGWTFQDMGDLNRAAEYYEQAAEGLGKLGDVRLAAVFECYLGLVRLDQRRFDDAAGLLVRAKNVLMAVGDRPGAAMADALLARLEAEQGQLDAAQALFKSSLEALTSSGAPALRDAATLVEGFIDLARSGRAELADQRSEARRLRDAVRERVRQALERERAEHCRSFVVRFLRQSLERRIQDCVDRPDLVVSVDGSWLERSGQAPQILSGRPVLRLVLARLAERSVDAPGEAVSATELLQAGWPDERMLPSSGANRLKWALSTLRALGIGDTLERSDEGYWLKPDACEVAIERKVADRASQKKAR